MNIKFLLFLFLGGCCQGVLSFSLGGLVVCEVTFPRVIYTTQMFWDEC